MSDLGEDLGTLIGDLIVDGIDAAMAPLLERLARAEGQLEALLSGGGTKASGGMVYRGVWQNGEAYPAGSVVTHGGSMWHADMETAHGPADGAGPWTLCVNGVEMRRTAGNAKFGYGDAGRRNSFPSC